MVRAVAAARTPVVSAIGHEGDAPLLDYVADYRASTPTDAARRIVPDLAQERGGVGQALARMRHRVEQFLTQERHAFDLLTSRPVLLNPSASLDSHAAALDAHCLSLRTAVDRRLNAENTALAQAQATLRALSPQATLERGYSMLRLPSGELIRDASQISKGSLIEGILANGRMVAQVVGSTPGTPPPPEEGA